MTERDKNLGDMVSSDNEDMSLSEAELAVLDRVPEDDREGLIARAKREGESLTEITLREDLWKEGLTEEEINQRNQDGFISRGFQQASGEFEGIKTRKKDDPNLLRAMFRMLVKAGYAVKTDRDSIIPAAPKKSLDVQINPRDRELKNQE